MCNIPIRNNQTSRSITKGEGGRGLEILILEHPNEMKLCTGVYRELSKLTLPAAPHFGKSGYALLIILFTQEK